MGKKVIGAARTTLVCHFHGVSYSSTISNTWLPAAVHREMWYLINKQVSSSSCSSTQFSMCPWAVFSAHYSSSVLKSYSCVLSLQYSLVQYLLASLKGTQKNQTGMLSGNVVQKVWHMLGQFVSPGQPQPYLCSLSEAPSLSIRPSLAPPTGETGVPWATVWYALQPWLHPRSCGWRVLWENSRSLKTKSKVQREVCKWKVAEASLISDIS